MTLEEEKRIARGGIKIFAMLTDSAQATLSSENYLTPKQMDQDLILLTTPEMESAEVQKLTEIYHKESIHSVHLIGSVRSAPTSEMPRSWENWLMKNKNHSLWVLTFG